MRWSTLVLSVTLFYSLSFVNAIPHDVYEKRHWLHRRQDLTGTPSPTPVVPTPPGVEDPQGDPTPSVSPADPPPQNTPRPSSQSSLTPTPRPPTATSQPPPNPSSSIIPTISSPISPSQSPSSTSSSVVSNTLSLPPSPTVTRPYQSSTSYRRFTSTYELPSDTSSDEGAVETGTESGNSFLNNKAAMGSTFAVVGLIGLAIIVGVIFFLSKRARQRRDEDEQDTYFEKLPANNDPSNQNSGGDSSYGLGPSAADLTTPASNQAYMSRDIHYGATNQYPNQYPSEYANYNGFEYPPERGSVIEPPASYVPGTAYAAAMAQRGPYQYEVQADDPSALPNPFADPRGRRY